MWLVLAPGVGWLRSRGGDGQQSRADVPRRRRAFRPGAASRRTAAAALSPPLFPVFLLPPGWI